MVRRRSGGAPTAGSPSTLVPPVDPGDGCDIESLPSMLCDNDKCESDPSDNCFNDDEREDNRLGDTDVPAKVPTGDEDQADTASEELKTDHHLDQVDARDQARETDSEEGSRDT